jgi:hypothetical protein
MKASLTGKLYFYYIETIAIMTRMIIMTECEIWGNEYDKNGYAGDVVPANWDNYIPIEELKMTMMKLKLIMWLIMVLMTTCMKRTVMIRMDLH